MSYGWEVSDEDVHAVLTANGLQCALDDDIVVRATRLVRAVGARVEAVALGPAFEPETQVSASTEEIAVILREVGVLPNRSVGKTATRRVRRSNGVR